MNATDNASQKITGRHVAIGIVGFFLCVLVADLILISLAVSTFGGIETTDAYRKGLNYNANIEAERGMKFAGWQSKLAFDKDRKILTLAIDKSKDRPLNDIVVTATIGRAATNRFDQTLVFSADRDGQYLAPWPEANPGSWVISTTIKSGDVVVYRTKERLWIAP